MRTKLKKANEEKAETIAAMDNELREAYLNEEVAEVEDSDWRFRYVL